MCPCSSSLWILTDSMSWEKKKKKDNSAENSAARMTSSTLQNM